jgi:hypothetical protein
LPIKVHFGVAAVERYLETFQLQLGKLFPGESLNLFVPESCHFYLDRYPVVIWDV